MASFKHVAESQLAYGEFRASLAGFSCSQLVMRAIHAIRGPSRAVFITYKPLNP